MGHADRPWLHSALGLDTQSRRVCLPSPWRCDSNTNTNGYTYSDSDGNTNGNPNRYTYSDAGADSNAAASTDSRA